MKKKFIGILLSGIILCSISLIGCEMNTDEKVTAEQERLLSEANNQTGLPNIKNFQVKKNYKKIIELQDDSNLITYAYTQNMNGKFVYIGKCMGYGVPYSTQYTNPQRRDRNNGDSIVLPQADPSGLFSPTSSDATWMMIISEETNEPMVMYCEPKTVVFQEKLPRRLCEEWSLPKGY